MNEHLYFDKLIIESIILETRFGDGYLYWDRCGKIWKNICEKWPDMEMNIVGPEKAVFKIIDEGLQLKFSPVDIHLSQEFPKSLKMFKEIAKSAIPLISDSIDVTLFNRIGNRIIYLYPTENVKIAETLFREFGLLNLKNDQIKAFGNEWKTPKVRFRIEEEKIGYTFEIFPFSRILNFEPPKPLKIDKSEFVENGILFNIDYHIDKVTELSMLDFSDLIDTVQKNLKYNLFKLIFGV